MKKNRFLLLLLAVFVSLTSFAATEDNVIYLKDVTGAPGTTVELPIYLKNPDFAVKSLQFTVELPSGVSFVENGSNYKFTKSTALTDDWTVIARTVEGEPTNTAMVSIYYALDATTTIAIGDEEVMTLSLSIAADADTGDKTVTLKSTTIVEEDGTEHTDASYSTTSKLTVGEVSYDEGYALTVTPFSFADDVETYATLTTKTDLTNIEFDVEASSAITDNELLELARKIGTTIATTSIDDNHVTITRKSTKTITDGTDILKLTFGYDPDILTEGIYTVTFKNIKMTDADGNVYSAAPYTADIYVGNPTATITDGTVAFHGDYSDEDAAVLLMTALPYDATVTTVDLTAVTALSEIVKINTVNPNALILTSTDLGFEDTPNVVIDKTCANLVLKDGNNFACSKKFTATTATYTRAMSTTWGTTCLPYAVTSNASVAYYKITGIDGDVLTIEQYETLPAGTPALVKKLSGEEIVPTAENVAVNGTLNDVTGTVTMTGSYTNDVQITDASAYYIKNNVFNLCNGKFYVDAFRAYFKVNAAGAKPSVLTIGEDEATAINALTGNSDVTVEGIYDVNGARLSDMKTGLNVIKLSNGKTQKIIIK